MWSEGGTPAGRTSVPTTITRSLSENALSPSRLRRRPPPRGGRGARGAHTSSVSLWLTPVSLRVGRFAGLTRHRLVIQYREPLKGKAFGCVRARRADVGIPPLRKGSIDGCRGRCPRRPETIERQGRNVAPGSGSEAVAESCEGTVLWTDNVEQWADCVWWNLRVCAGHSAPRGP